MTEFEQEIAFKYVERRIGTVTQEELLAAQSWITEDFVFALIDCEDALGALSDDNFNAFMARMRKEFGADCADVKSGQPLEVSLADVAAAMNDVEAEWHEREVKMRLKGLYLV